MDGARMMNAAVALGVPPAEVGSRVDTVTLCLSKGLGCPLGAVLAGPADLMAVAWRQKFLFGGAMRQAGIVAAAASTRSITMSSCSRSTTSARVGSARVGTLPGCR